MPDAVSFPRYIFGLHEPGGEYLMEQKGKQGWIVFTHGLGHDPNNHFGQDFRQWTDRGFGIIARLNHGYGAAGTIPQPQHVDGFAKRVYNFCRNSPGCHVWIIGNEMNHEQERPGGQIITPAKYAACYKKCWEQIHTLPGREKDQVVIGAVAPWNNTTAYPGNESGDWIRYFTDIIQAIQDLDCPVDAITLHTYTHGHDPNLVFSKQKMNPPFQNRHYDFRCYRDFMHAIPQDLRHLPVYITETDQNEAWENADRGWVQNAYQEIDDWNTTPGNQQIRALVLYRWPRYDRWYIEGKEGVHDDFSAAMDREAVWREMKLPREVNGYTLKGAFLEFFDAMGQDICGLPISEQVLEDGLPTQYFERIVLQQSLSGHIVLKAIGSEVQSLRQTVTECQNQAQALQNQVNSLQQDVYTLRNIIAEYEAGAGPEQPGAQVIEIVRPAWQNVVLKLPRHAAKRYATRAIEAIQYLTISHSAVPATVSARAIAKFHVEQMKWPGIGYHFYIGEDGQVQKTNDLSTVCFHVGQMDPFSVGICVGGNFTDDVPNQAQLTSAAHLLAWLLQDLGLPLEAIKGKREFVDTQSPGYQWLDGKQWKATLLAEVKKAQTEERKPHPPKLFHHYMLFWQRSDAWAEEEWYGAKDYINRFRVTHGFSVKHAEVYRYVTIVGDTNGVDRQEELTLLGSGCRVERIAGRNASETSETLTAMARRGQRFLDYAG